MNSLHAVCRAYAAHVGLPEPPGGFCAELDGRLALWPVWARLAARLCAFALRWLCPSLVLGRISRFEGLGPADRETLLQRLQNARLPLVRAAFLLVKSPVLGSCYGAEAARKAAL